MKAKAVKTGGLGLRKGLKNQKTKKEFATGVAPYFDLFSYFLEQKEKITTFDTFDFPEYAGYPQPHTISTELVDRIQDRWGEVQQTKGMSELVSLLLP